MIGNGFFVMLELGGWNGVVLVLIFIDGLIGVDIISC